MIKEPFNWKKELFVPMVLTIFTGLVGICVAYSWEFFKFKRETLFEKRIDLILESRKQVADVYVEFDRIRRQIRSNEVYFKEQGSGCDPKNLKSQVEEIKAIGLRLNHIDEFSKVIVSNTEVADNVKLFKEQLKEYLECIKRNTNCEVCTDKFPELMAPLQKVIELHTLEINTQVEINK